ncbi:hypothetical protein DMB66_29550 [Actinoplanes sp. ATCC 53533]|nr:hypothetical protein DMB66_29550 [Actinoplanes sp. ATCC 53533]
MPGSPAGGSAATVVRPALGIGWTLVAAARCHSAARLPGCPAARLPGCPAARLPGCPAARLPGCPAARLPGCPAARLPGCPAARLPGCPAARLPPGWRGGVLRRRSATTPRCPRLNSPSHRRRSRPPIFRTPNPMTLLWCAFPLRHASKGIRHTQVSRPS